jgi:hypothetical protein
MPPSLKNGSCICILVQVSSLGWTTVLSFCTVPARAVYDGDSVILGVCTEVILILLYCCMELEAQCCSWCGLIWPFCLQINCCVHNFIVLWHFPLCRSLRSQALHADVDSGCANETSWCEVRQQLLEHMRQSYSHLSHAIQSRKFLGKKMLRDKINGCLRIKKKNHILKKVKNKLYIKIMHPALSIYTIQ